MNANKLVQRLGEAFGSEMVSIKSQFHIQVSTKPGVTHNIWINKEGNIKWQLHGQRGTSSGSPDKMLAKIGAHKPELSQMGKMQSSLDLSKKITEVGKLASQQGILRGIFCDAGFKDGRGRISVIAIVGESISAFIEPVEAKDNNDAELKAIILAVARIPNQEIPIYSDSKVAVRLAQEEFGNRIHWIAREANKVADSVANLRGNTQNPAG